MALGLQGFRPLGLYGVRGAPKALKFYSPAWQVKPPPPFPTELEVAIVGTWR